MVETQNGDSLLSTVESQKKKTNREEAEERMGGSGNKEELDAKWDACVDLTLRRFLYSSLAGAFGGLLLFRSPTARWALVAFGAGVGIGSAYTECSGSPTKLAPPKVSHTPLQNVQDSE